MYSIYIYTHTQTHIYNDFGKNINVMRALLKRIGRSLVTSETRKYEWVNYKYYVYIHSRFSNLQMCT